MEALKLWRERIVADPAILVGKPTVRGTRMSVEFILDLFSGGWTLEQVLEEYPHLTAEDVRAVFAYAADVVRSDELAPLVSYVVE
jgi:uncharacterized protein (DUF433 family)